MALSWNEIKERALQFSKEWESTAREEADAKPFLIDFFHIFGIIQRKVSTFEYRVQKLDERDGYIDMLWKGTLLIEMKSRGRNLDDAYQQAREYLDGLKQHELPKHILVSDFDVFRLYELETDEIVEFHLSELVNNVQHFGFIAGYQKREYKEQDPVNIKAAELMGKLHDKLKEVGYEGHPLELYLVRLLFLLFADDSTIFDKDIFIDFIEEKTAEDGSDLAAHLTEVFYVLNTPIENRLKNIDEHLNRFPYINGKLFEEQLPPASFDSGMRKILIECSYLDWGKISPAIFGSMFQSVMNPIERRNLGAHYTSEKNILKLIKPLFLDELWTEFESIKGNKNKLIQFHLKLSKLKFLDPACGCGNFLIITYRELRLLELEILRELDKSGQRVIDISSIVLLSVEQFYGIEYEEFPARIAEVAMWLIDHQMNMMVSQEFGQYFVRLPLTESANIVHGNALELNWVTLKTEDVSLIFADNLNYKIATHEPVVHYGTVNVVAKNINQMLPNEEFPSSPTESIHYDYILGNPPFIGSKMMTQLQRDEVKAEFDNVRGSGVLDYVTAWYAKAAKLIQGSNTKVAFVSTNSIVQGEQTGILWEQMLKKYEVKIHFAHRTFKWSNEAKGNAAVYCVIIGFANFDTNNKRIFDYEDISGEPHEIKAKNINPYLVDSKDILITKRTKPLCDVPAISKGNQPTEGGNLIMSEFEKEAFIAKYPILELHIKKLIGAAEFIHNKPRYCFWFPHSVPPELRQIKELRERLKLVQEMRKASTDPKTRELANQPYRFREMRNYESFVIIPSTTSENRQYIPIGFGDKDTIPTNALLIVPNGSVFHFGVLMSAMHMAWVRATCGRLESRYRYSKDIVYNNFPWPESISNSHVKAIEKAAKKVLSVRGDFSSYSFADLYDPLTMPPALVDAHKELDKAVDLAYRPQAFSNEPNRMEYLFGLYEKYTLK